MINTILGKKLNMDVRFDERGRRIPVTQIEAGPCHVLQVKTKEKDGYVSVQLGFGKRKKGKKQILGHVKKARLDYFPRYLREAQVKENVELPKIGDILAVSGIFEVGDLVKVTGISKGKGFTGVVKRWGFAGGPRTHGQSDRERAPGSIGQTTTPGRVYKGKKMAGRKGAKKVTIRGLEVVNVDPQNNLLEIKGSVPGARGGFLIIEKIGKVKAYTPPPEAKHVKEEEEKEPKETEEKGGSPTSPKAS